MIGIALEAMLIALPAIQERTLMARIQKRQQEELRRARPITRAQRDSVLRQLRDSFGISMTVRGDTITDITLSPERRQELAKLERGLGSALTRIAIIGTVIAAVVYGAIPVVLIAITTAWIRARRAAQAEIAAHVA